MTKFLDKTVLETFKLYPCEGELGIEVEVESNSKLPNAINENWKVMLDGSLRGEAKEYVFNKPLNKKEAFEEINILYDVLQGKINDSMRAGLHVHVNCQKLTMRELFNFLTSYYCLENLITEEAGEERQGNLFCLRLCDANYISTGIMSSLVTSDVKADGGIFTNENLRYAAMNLVSLSKFGSVEFRALRTPTTKEKVLEWVDLIHTLKINSTTNFKTPLEIISSMSANGVTEVVEKLLGKHAKKQISKPHFEESVYEGMRQIQHWVFLTNWENN